jgi:hypothetical protein
MFHEMLRAVKANETEHVISHVSGFTTVSEVGSYECHDGSSGSTKDVTFN